MFKAFRFLDTPYLKPCENMAIDEALLQNFTFASLPILRFYSWEKDAFSIGRFQNPTQIENFSSFGKNFTRRTTGGGLLLHGSDISYSLLLPTNLLQNKSVKESYEYLCSFLLLFYKKIGLSPYFAKDMQGIELAKSAFCQVGYEPYDVLIKGKKVGGNAQKRTKEFIYQHGSIPLHVDTREFSGANLQEFGIKQDLQEIKQLIKESFCEAFDTTLISDTLSFEELEAFQSLHVNKYDTKEWRYESTVSKTQN